jgi:uncharacterized delta-60 repeat protein
MSFRGGSRPVWLVVATGALLVFPLLAIAKPTVLDKHFGHKGLAVAQVGQDGSGANLVAVADDGGIIAAGMSIFAEGEDSDGDFVVAKFTPKGKLDPKFGGKGANIVDFGDEYTFDVPEDLALTDQGKILVAGDTADDDGAGAAITRLDSDGKLDQSLAGDGTLTAHAGGLESASAVLPLPNGAFYAIGPSKKSLEIARFTADGSVDQSFGTGGFTLTDLGAQASVGHAVLTDNGKIVVVAHPSEGPSTYLPGVPKGEFALLRFTSAGVLDATFGQDGIAVADGSAVTNLVQDAKGNLIAGGGDHVVRFTEDGQLDGEFARGGIFTFSSASGFAGAGLAVGVKGSVVVSGSAKAHKSKAAAKQQFAVAELTSAGSLDRKFGKRGFVMNKHGDAAKAVTTQDDGKIIAAGRTFGRSIFIGNIAGRETKMMLTRYLAP